MYLNVASFEKPGSIQTKKQQSYVAWRCRSSLTLVLLLLVLHYSSCVAVAASVLRVHELEDLVEDKPVADRLFITQTNESPESSSLSSLSAQTTDNLEDNLSRPWSSSTTDEILLVPLLQQHQQHHQQSHRHEDLLQDDETIEMINSNANSNNNNNNNNNGLIRNARRKTYRNKYLTDPTNNSPLQRKSAKKRFKIDRNLQRVEKKSWNLPTQTLGHYLDIKDQAKQTARKANELRKLLNSVNDY